MATAWYALVVGILMVLDGIVFLIFDVDGFTMPNWYIGIVLLTGVVGIILGMIFIMKNRSGSQPEAPAERDIAEEDSIE